MKNIRVIIAFLSIYLFLGLLITVIAVSRWLSLYTPEVGSAQMLLISSSTLKEEKASFEVTKYIYPSALEAMISRSETLTQKKQEKMLDTRGIAVFVTIEKVTFSDSLVPLGFRSMYRITKISNATGQELYKVNSYSSDISEGSQKCISGLACFSRETIPVIASDKPTTYAITFDTNGLHNVIR